MTNPTAVNKAGELYGMVHMQHGISREDGGNLRLLKQGAVLWLLLFCWGPFLVLDWCMVAVVPVWVWPRWILSDGMATLVLGKYIK